MGEIKLSSAWDQSIWPGEFFDTSPEARWSSSLADPRKRVGPVSATLGREAEASWPPWAGLGLTPDKIRIHKAPGNGAVNAWLMIVGAAEGTSDSSEQEQEHYWDMPCISASHIALS